MIYKKNGINNTNRNPMIIFMSIFFLFFIMLLVYRQVGNFSDEIDNFLGGLTVSNGGQIYREFYSQHTPGMYYLCAIFTKLGATTIEQSRILFYAILALSWTIMYKVYARDFGQKAMFFYPILYICIMGSMDYGHMMLSDQIQAQAMVILLLEFLLFSRNKKTNTKNNILISISIFVAISVAFVSVFAVVIIGLGVFLIEIMDSVQDKLNAKEFFIKLFKKYWKLILSVLIPFILAFIFLVAEGLLTVFYEQAYRLNTQVYSKYLGGFGNNGLKVMVGTVGIYFDMIQSTIKTFFGNPFDGIRILINVFINIFFLIFLYIKKNKSAAFVIAPFILMTGVRGYIGFHSLSYWAVSAIMGVIMISDWLENHKSTSLSDLGYKNIVIIIFGLLIITIPYLKVLPNILPNKQDFTKSQYTKFTLDYYIDKLTNKDEKIFISNIGLIRSYIDANRLPASRVYSMVPWFMEVFEDDLIKDISNNNTKLIEYNPENLVWNHKLNETAHKFESYLNENYKLIKSPDNGLMLWIRNDFYDEAKKILELKEPIFSIDEQQMTVVGPIRDGKEFTQVFKGKEDKISKIKVQTGTYARVNKSQFEMTIMDIETKKVLYKSNIDISNFKDNLLNEIEVPNIQIEKNKEYSISFKAYNTSDNDFITIYRTQKNLNEEKGYAIVDGVKQEYNLNVNVY